MAVAISSGFRKEIRNGISAVSGDVVLSEDEPFVPDSTLLVRLGNIEGVDDVSCAIYRPGVVKKGNIIQGMLVKGVHTSDSSLHARIPASLARVLSVKVGDSMLSYFIGEKVKVRKFIVSDIYEGIVDTDENMLVYVPIEDVRRINGWTENQVSAVEVRLSDSWRGRREMAEKAAEIGMAASMYAVSSVEKYASIFDWLDLVDRNVVAILVLMTLVAGFNMISGLLIMLFRNVSTIGVLKSLGMENRSIAGIFVRVASRAVFYGMVAGNAAALLFCLVQGTTHIFRLNPENYFVPFVPVSLDARFIISADVVSFAVILLLMLVPCFFIAKVDPARTVKAE